MNPKEQNNSDKLQSLFKKAKGTVLTDQEKEIGRLKLREYMDSYSKASIGNEYAPEPAMWHVSLYRFLSGRKIYTSVGIAIFLMLIVGGSISQTARGTLPGDALYPWRLSVNEKLKTFMAGSPMERAHIETVQASSRLYEIEKLASKGELTQSKRAEAEVNFNKRVGGVLASISELKQKGDAYEAASASGNLESMLLAHRNVMESLPEPTRTADIAAVESGITDALITSVQIRNESEYDASASNDLEKVRMAAMDAKSDTDLAIFAAKRRFEDQAGNRVASIKAEEDDDDTFGRYRSALSYQTEAASKLGSGAYGEAILLFGKAHRLAEQASLQAEAERSIGIKIRTVKKVAPVAPSGIGTTSSSTQVAPNGSASSNEPTSTASPTTTSPTSTEVLE